MQKTINKNHEFLMNKADELELNEYRKIGSLEDFQKAMEMIKSIEDGTAYLEEPCTAGILCVSIAADEDMPEAYIYLKRNSDGEYIDLVKVSGDSPLETADQRYDCGVEISVYKNDEAMSYMCPPEYYFITKEHIDKAEPPC